MHDHGDLHVHDGIIHVEAYTGILEMPLRQCLFVIQQRGFIHMEYGYLTGLPADKISFEKIMQWKEESDNMTPIC